MPSMLAMLSAIEIKSLRKVGSPPVKRIFSVPISANAWARWVISFKVKKLGLLASG